MKSFRKIGVIIAHDLYGKFADRHTALLMLAVPLTISTIIGLAFGGIARGEMGFDPIPIAVVNLDQAQSVGGREVALGEQFAHALTPSTNSTADPDAGGGLAQIIAARAMTDADAARALVQSGDIVAALVIPPDFSAGVGQQGADTPPTALNAELYTDPAKGDLGGIVSGIVTSIGNRIATGNAAISAATEGLNAAAASQPEVAARLQGVTQNDPRFDPSNFAAILADDSALPLKRETASGEEATFNPFVLFGSSQAIFFMLFAASAISVDFLRDKRNGILARLLATPTRIASIILGKIGAAATICAVQVILLFTALTIISAVATGQFAFIFGTNLLGLLAIIAAVSLAAAGLAMAVASLARSPEQAQAINTVIAVIMGVLGGAFFGVQDSGIAATLSRFTINYWAVDAVNSLAQGDNSIWLNLAVLLLIAVVTLSIAFTRFSRTLEA